MRFRPGTFSAQPKDVATPALHGRPIAAAWKLKGGPEQRCGLEAASARNRLEPKMAVVLVVVGWWTAPIISNLMLSLVWHAYGGKQSHFKAKRSDDGGALLPCGMSHKRSPQLDDATLAELVLEIVAVWVVS